MRNKKKLVEFVVYCEGIKFEVLVGYKLFSVFDLNLFLLIFLFYIVKVKNIVVRWELDDIYFLCECFFLILFLICFLEMVLYVILIFFKMLSERYFVGILIFYLGFKMLIFKFGNMGFRFLFLIVFMIRGEV